MFRNIDKNWNKALKVLKEVEIKRNNFTIHNYIDNAVLVKRDNTIYAFPINDKIKLESLSKAQSSNYRPKIQIHRNLLNLWSTSNKVPTKLWQDVTLSYGIKLGIIRDINLGDKKSIKDKIMMDKI